MSELPAFRYHPDPVATGSIEASDVQCVVCVRQRGFIYTGPVFAVDDLLDAICPWCIADGSAAARFEAEFTDVGWGVPDGVPDTVVAEIAHRTPGFSGWQQEHWLYHCNDGAAFLGRVGGEELSPFPDAVEALRHEHDGLKWSADDVERYIAALDKDGQPCAYLFRCLRCGQHLAYSDFT